MESNKFPFHKIENFTNAYCYDVRKVDVVKRNNYFVDDSITIDGDAPKKFIGIYDYRLLNSKHKRHRNNWIRYIAKTGHKWYPIESITEMLLNRLGTIFGLKMADSMIAMIGGQLRFLSRYFLHTSKEELVHGADILAGYFNDSSQFVEEVDKQKLTREWFTLQLVDSAVSSMFLYQKDEIMHELTKLVIFDALVGNNDRHFFNWGVIRSVDGSFQPHFSPVYDTARGLFWNYSESKLANIVEVNRNIDSHIRRYCKNSRPKIGWKNEKSLNHFELFDKIYTSEYNITKKEVKDLLALPVLEAMIQEVRKNFQFLMSVNRITMICKCLEYRFNKLQNIL
ncbi:MAG: HipA domain-containing protein [Prevotella micans]|nr:HipA domain-containing protein [uncultured Prevotella sp.]MBF1436561.1 HipA domain-containing protein [Prevotella micans]